MASLELLLAFALATAIFAYMPGPAVLYIAAQTLSRGRRAGFMAVAGIHLADYVHVLAAAFGLSAIFRHVPELYLAVKLIGAAYLVWLGIGLVMGARRAPAATEAAAAAAKSPRRAFLESVTVELLNPKTAIFFISFLPQFVDPAGSLPLWAQFLILGVIVNLTFTSSSVITVFAAAFMKERVGRNGAVQRALKAAGGTILVALGVRLALDRS